MEVLYLLIPLSILLLILIVWIFLWALRSGQFDDLDGPAQRILFDEDIPVSQSIIEPITGTVIEPVSGQKKAGGEAPALKNSTLEDRN
ncbi:MAG: cbb3-type cytochrome oxidase maturation protein [Planctomycetota bacterium]|jgi:cbb3-type cytochrome oxidase maturation protein